MSIGNTINAQNMRKMIKKGLDDMLGGKIDTKTAAVLINAHGKMNQSAGIQVKYYAARDEIPEIEYLIEDKRLWTRR